MKKYGVTISTEPDPAKVTFVVEADSIGQAAVRLYAVDELIAALREITERYAALDARLVAGKHNEPNGTVGRARAALAKAGAS
jgi:hypothetical protein